MKITRHNAWTLAQAAVVLLVIVGVAIWYGRDTSRRDAFGKTTGQIVVASPEVFSRERLVNDRFQETTWLEDQLRSTEQQIWGNQAASRRDSRDVQHAGVQLSTTPGDSPTAQQKDALQDHAGNGGGDAPELQPNVGDTHGSLGSDDVRASPIDTFRDKLAFREEVRAASMETQLDDRHDIAGNTLYRVKFSVTVIPEQDTSAWAVVYVELGEPPDGDHGRPDYADIYRDWREYYQDQLNYELDRLTEAGTRAWQLEEFRDFSAYVAVALKESACPNAEEQCQKALVNRTAAALARTRAAVRTDLDVQVQQCKALARAQKQPASGCEVDQQVSRWCQSTSEAPRLCPWNVDNYVWLEALMKVYEQVLYRDVAPASIPSGQFFRRVVAEYLLKRLADRTGSDWNALSSASTTDCEIGLCRISLGEKEGAVDAFARALKADQVFAYAVSPKEAVQRIADMASSARERQLVLRAGLSGTPLPLDLLNAVLAQSKAESLQLNTVLRQPLVVGFAEAAGLGSNDVSNPSAAAFGWVIGPKFEIAENGARFRHATIENDVSAIISVPSWWKWAQVRMVTCWMDERAVHRASTSADGVLSYLDCRRQQAKSVSHLVRLPGNVSEVARKLGLDVVRRPSLFRQIEQVAVTADEPADILIRGNHLWRSTVVTLEGQQANNITVLPDMKGILAHFAKVSPQWIGENRQVWVFTSEGEAFAGSATVKAPRPTETQIGMR